jgi:hypothetical protein
VNTKRLLRTLVIIFVLAFFGLGSFNLATTTANSQCERVVQPQHGDADDQLKFTVHFDPVPPYSTLCGGSKVLLARSHLLLQ